MSDLTITVKHLQHGQPRRYADHIYESEITIEGERAWDRLVEDQVKNLAKAVVHPFHDEPEGWASARLDEVTRLSSEREDKLGACREVWRVRVRVPYTD